MLATFRRLRAACRVDTHPYIYIRDSRHQHILTHSRFQVIRSLAISARKRRQISDESADAAKKRYTNLGCMKMNRSRGDLFLHDPAKWPLLTQDKNRSKAFNIFRCDVLQFKRKITTGRDGIVFNRSFHQIDSFNYMPYLIASVLLPCNRPRT